MQVGGEAPALEVGRVEGAAQERGALLVAAPQPPGEPACEREVRELQHEQAAEQRRAGWRARSAGRSAVMDEKRR